MIESSPTTRCSGTRIRMFAETIGKAAILRPRCRFPRRDHAPEVDELYARGDDELAVRAVRDADDHDVALLDEGLFRDERRILRVLVRIQDRRVMKAQDLAQLVRQRITDVVDVGLERHAQNADLLLSEVIALAQLLDDEVRQPLVQVDGEISQWKAVVLEGDQLHRVLHETGTGGEAR